MLLPAVTINCKPHNNLASKGNNTDTKVSPANNQISDKGKGGQKLDHMGSKSRTSKLLVRTANTAVSNKNAALHVIATSGNTIITDKINSSIKKNDGNNESLKSADESHNSNKSAFLVVSAKQQSSGPTFSGVRSISTCANSNVHSVKNPKDYAVPKKFSVEADSGIKSYPIQSDYKESVSMCPDYKSRNNSGGGGGSGSGNAAMTGNLPLRFAAQSSAALVLHRENTPSNMYTQSGPGGSIPRNEHNSAFAIARKALEQQQQNSMPKMAPINFPPLRAPQSIVNVRHPLLTDACAAKHASEMIGGPTGGKSKHNIMSSLQGGVKDLADHGRSQTAYHGYGTSPIAAGIPSGMQNLGNAVAASISPYPRPDSFPQPTVASVLFSDTAAQFPQSTPPFNTTQLGQLNQYQTYDPTGSFATTPVNVNPVMPQFSAESSIPYPQYENPPQFVQPNHYPTADMTNSQYQYQAAAAAAASVGQIQDSSMFIQNLQSPIAVTDQYAAPNYARAVRTDLIPRRLRPPRFNK